MLCFQKPLPLFPSDLLKRENIIGDWYVQKAAKTSGRGRGGGGGVYRFFYNIRYEKITKSSLNITRRVLLTISITLRVWVSNSPNITQIKFFFYLC